MTIDAAAESIVAINSIPIHTFSRDDNEQVLRQANGLIQALACASWGHKMGWKIPERGSSEWYELLNAWMEDGRDVG